MHWLFKNHLGNILHYFKYLLEHKIDMPCLTKTTVTHLNDLIRFAVVQLLVLAPSYKTKTAQYIQIGDVLVHKNSGYFV